MDSNSNAAELDVSTEASWAEMDEHYKAGLIANIRARMSALGISFEGHAYVRSAAAMPSRLVRSTPKSFSGIYPSRKMGVSVGFESRTLELPAVMTLEHDDGVLAYFDQPPSISVRYKRDGRIRSNLQTPDFLVVRHDEVILVECKTLAKIHLRNASDPGYFVQEGKRWYCPALQDAARKLGMRHEVWCEDNFSLFRLRNLRMLDDYLLRSSDVEGYDDALAAVEQYLNTVARADIQRLLKDLHEDVSVDHLYSAIAKGDVAFDWDGAPLSDQARCFVYRDQNTLEAFAASELARVAERDRMRPSTVEIAPGVMLDWDGVIWQCENAGLSTITLCRPGRDQSRQPMPRAVLNTLISTGAVKAANSADALVPADTEVQDRIGKASENDLREANRRHTLIVPYLAPDARAPSSRSIRRYLASYRHAESMWGNGYIGLLPNFSKAGNRDPRLMTAVLDIAIELVNREYLAARNINKKAVYNLIEDACSAKGLPPPSYSWLCRFIDRLPAFTVARARKGSKGAYPLEAPQSDASNIDKMEPERAFERVHIDHTLCDVETLFGETSEPLGRVWITCAIDHHSRRILAHYLTYDAPSYRSVLMVMRKCVKRWGRLPDCLVVDGGKEFFSLWFETFCALYKIKVLRRPVTKARFGSQIERFFGTTCTNFFNFLSGNTQLRKNVRQLTGEVDPDTHAVWTLPELDKAISTYFYEVYDIIEHRTLLMTPRFAFEKSMERHGLRAERRVIDNELFRITSSPAPAHGTAKVTRDGVKIHYQYFYSPDLQRHIGKSLKVRYDPFDKSLAWAFAGGQWVRLKSRNQEVFQSLTEHDIELAVTEWRKRRSNVEKTRLSEQVLVKFLKEIRQTESLLLARRRAAEERRLRESEDADNQYDDATDDVGDNTADADAESRSAAETQPAAKAQKPVGPAKKTTSAKAQNSSFADFGDELETLETLS